ncbi:hypothetical protein Ae201684P_000687 [Aphanomyces euteiches]|nr:hypothetical protein Ae201684P_000687 [Aphanomyces euteiches]
MNMRWNVPLLLLLAQSALGFLESIRPLECFGMYEILARYPMVAYIHEPIVSADEISHLLDTYRSRLDASSSSYSASMYLNWTTEAQVALIVPRVLNTVQNVFPQTSVHVESVALTLYTRGQSYGWHLDAYNQNTLRSRAFTFLVYLNDVDEGGETVFAHVASNGAFIVRKPSLAQACAIDSRHVRSKPNAGHALLFKNLPGYISTHGSCILGSSSKWIMQFWLSAQ